MTVLIEIIFFLSILFAAYVYVGYPAAVMVLSVLRNRKVKKANVEPTVTILIAAYNEGKVISRTIANKLVLDYPSDKLEILVVSDGSTDNTDELVKQFKTDNVCLLRQEPRAGKTAALNMAVEHAKGEILVFSDANSIYAPDALRNLVRAFADEQVGYVTGKMIYTNPDGTTVGDGCTAYMKYENALRGVESKVGSVVGVDGGIDAVRKSLYRPMRPDQLPDFVLPLMVIEQGYRVVYEPKAILREFSLKDASDEYRMRVRVSLRAFWALRDMRHLLTFTRSLPSSSDTPLHPRTFAPSFLYSWQLWSHKLLRYLCFLFLIGAYVANAILWPEHLFYRIIFIIQTVGYVGALVQPVLEKRGIGFNLFRFARYFLLINAAAAHAFIKFLMGKKQVLWTPRKG